MKGFIIGVALGAAGNLSDAIISIGPVHNSCIRRLRYS